ncbi:MAG: acetyl-CoA carboxylase biotin carboxyl carrier protein subunit [Saccharofermentans sp.]|nr:acetyl-CoA carboxylase biotin carboxyl carrier protein subunit [Saccharofermentans sp.]
MSKYRITLEGRTYEMDVEFIDGSGASKAPAAQAAPKAAAPSVSPAAAQPAPVKQANAEVTAGSVVAPMPGTVIKIFKNPGDAVTAREVVMILEAMKMENEIIAPADGTIASINCTVGGTVAAGDVLFEVK